MLTIEPVVDAAELPTIRAMFREYADSLALELEFQDFSGELASLPGKYAMPSGCILVARVDGEPAGCVALRAIGDGVSEMKRLYVRPEFRGLGLGRKLAERIIGEARGRGYERIRLDTIPSRMAGAVCLYRALEFRDIPPYCDNPFPDAMFLELRLS